MHSDSISSDARLEEDGGANHATKDLMTFCVQLVHLSQWKSERIFHCGSMVDLPCYRDIVECCMVDKSALDSDHMAYSTSRYAAGRSVTFPETYSGSLIRIYTDDVHAGYARLFKEKDDTELLRSDLRVLDANEKMHGPAVYKDNKEAVVKDTFSLSDASLDLAESNNVTIKDRDDVYAVHSPYWPAEAGEWITRRRDHGFPSKSVIKRVVGYGCDFVQVSHNRLNNDGEWRFSFSRAEQIISRSWTMSQRIVYSTLWVLNKKMKNSKLCTYYFKTLMFWACEEKPTEFWSDDLLVEAVGELLNEMMTWVKAKFCPNYFIPSNNMMDHLIDTDLSYEIESLSLVKLNFVNIKSCHSETQSCNNTMSTLDICRLVEEINDNMTGWIESPAWVKRAFLIYRRVDNDYDNYRDLFSSDLNTDFERAIQIELMDIYKGLRCQEMSKNEVDKHSYFSKAEEHLLDAASLCESQERDVILNITNELAFLMINDYTREHVSSPEKKTNCGQDVDDLNLTCDCDELKRGDCDEVKCGHKENNKPNNPTRLRESTFQNRTIRIDFHKETRMNDQSDSEKTINDWTFKEWPGHSPTVNIAWFITKAYLANLYYTTQRDIRLTIKTCDDIIEVYKQSKMNNRFAERTFPVVLSTQWTSIYDKEIQELLGFYSLCSYVFDQSSRSVYLGVCPVQFALYMKLRLVQKKENDLSIHDCVNNWNVHIDKCLCDSRVRSGTPVLCEALGRTLARLKIRIQTSQETRLFTFRW